MLGGQKNYEFDNKKAIINKNNPVKLFLFSFQYVQHSYKFLDSNPFYTKITNFTKTIYKKGSKNKGVF